MATSEQAVVNGVDVSALEGVVEHISEDTDVGMFTFRAETEWSDALKCVTTINEFDQAGETISTRDFTVEADEPEEILGERTAPNPVELLLSALGSCLTISYSANAAAMGITLQDLRFEMEGDVDLRGFLGISEDVRPGFDAIQCTVYIDSDASATDLEALQERVESTSPLMDNIGNAVQLQTEVVAN